MDVRATLRTSWLIAIAVFAAHNLEETVAMANGWANDHLPQLAWTADRWPLFGAAAFTLTLAVALVAWRLRGRPERSAFWLKVFMVIMLLNAAWHVGVSVFTRSLAPGVVTAVLLILPVYTAILYRLVRRPRGTR